MKIMIFDDDSDFEMFAVGTNPYVKESGGRSWVDWDFSDDYLEEVKNNTIFFIKDSRSKIAKRQAVTCGVTSKRVKNVRFYDEDYIDILEPEVEIEDYTEKYNINEDKNMKIMNFNEFDLTGIKNISEAAVRGKKVVSGDDYEVPVRLGDDIVDYNDVDEKDIVGHEPSQDSDSIFSRFTVDAPMEGDSKRFDDKKVWSENLATVYDAIGGRVNFFIQGEAGWAKTAIITQMAKKFGYHVITVYLDKALPEDLGGMPIVKTYKTRNNRTWEIVVPVMPWWGQYMLEHPDKKFLLFFDELNQASNDVMKALMPICHPTERRICDVRFKNYFVGAAGNMSYENDLESIPRPLMSRLGGRPRAWICGTDKDPKAAAEAWDDAFDYLHEKWDTKIGKNIVDAFNKYRTMFASPRDIDLNLFEKFYALKNNSKIDKNRISLEAISQKIQFQTRTAEGTQWHETGVRDVNEYTPQIKRQVDELAEIIYDYIMLDDPNKSKRAVGRKTTAD